MSSPRPLVWPGMGLYPQTARSRKRRAARRAAGEEELVDRVAQGLG